jgi:hypothetical protein
MGPRPPTASDSCLTQPLAAGRKIGKEKKEKKESDGVRIAVKTLVESWTLTSTFARAVRRAFSRDFRSKRKVLDLPPGWG